VTENPRFIRPEDCICPMFTDIGERRIADLNCPVHDNDGFWEVRQDE
jgi:hypothetical protein